jgi:hypothetical protein
LRQTWLFRPDSWRKRENLPCQPFPQTNGCSYDLICRSTEFFAAKDAEKSKTAEIVTPVDLLSHFLAFCRTLT